MEDTISNRIRQLRSSLGYSQEYLAEKLELTQQAYSRIEANPEKASLERLRTLAKLLRIDLATLIGENRSLVQHNISQKGGNATQMIFSDKENQTHLHGTSNQEEVMELRKEVDRLKEMITGKKGDM